VHFRQVSAKIKSKNLKHYFDWRESGPPEPTAWLRPCTVEYNYDEF